jgi:glycosyltransferase involved in cell wall biosynthesis
MCGQAMAKIKVALCITELDLGGAERCLTELALRVDRERFEPVVYCLGPRPKRDDASCVPKLEAGGIEVHCLGGQEIWQFPTVARRLGGLLKSQSPQIAQTFLFHANVFGRIVARRAGVRTVISGVRVAERKSRWHLWLDRLTQSWVDRYVCVSRSVADFSAAEGGISPKKLVIIPNGIDIGRYSARQPADLTALGIQAGQRVVTFVGRLEPQKGVEWLIATARPWLDTLPGCDLLLVGEGSLRQRLEASCRVAGIAERVHFAGWRTDVSEILAASDLLVLPSGWEGMPNVVLEAMASRLPVVATDVEGVRELLGPAAPQQTVRFGDTPGLIKKLATLMLDPDMATAIGEENRRRAEQDFSISHMVTAYQDLWESLVAG